MKQNFGDALPKLTADVVCLRGTFMCNGIFTTLNKDSCWNYEEFLSAAFPFFPIPYLFCQIATGRQQHIFQKLVSLSLYLNSNESYFYMFSSIYIGSRKISQSL
jgi:hypothetical protein